MKRKPAPRLLKETGAVLKTGPSGRGVLLLHGWKGNPLEMKYLGERLFRAGYSISIPRYPGHGTSLEEMTRTSERDWYTAAREALIEFQDHCPDLYLAGLSMGGIISLLLAKEFSISRIALLSTPRALPDRRIYLAPFVGRILKTFPDPDQTLGINSEEARGRHVCYRGIPVLQGWYLHRLVRKAMKALPRVTSDALLIQARLDSFIPASSMDYIYDRIGSSVKERVLLEKSNHTITVDYEKELVAEKIIEFFGRKGDDGAA